MNRIEGKWKGAGGGIQVFFLILLWYFGLVLAISITQALFGEDVHSSAYSLRFNNAIGSIFLFFMPVIVYFVLFADTKGKFLNKKKISWLVLFLGVLAIFCVQPFIELVNTLIKLPEWLSELQKVLDQEQETSKKAMQLLFADQTASNFLMNFLVMAILPGVLEELFFRGCMQRSILQISKNTHVAIWTTAVIFSLFHFQITGFFPRILLGALLGYLYAWSGNIWVPIVMHVFNNAVIVFLEQFMQGTEIYKLFNSSSETMLPAIISFVLTSTILLIVYKETRKDITESPSC